MQTCPRSLALKFFTITWADRCEIPVRVCFSSLWVAELLSGVAKIFGLPSFSTMPAAAAAAAEMEKKGAKRRNEKIARKIINLREKESCVASERA